MSRIDRRAFTLIELLVVIAIIAVIIAILLPALSGARQRGRGLECASRMRQVATGWQIYADENDAISVAVQMGREDDVGSNVFFVGNGYHYRPRWYAMIGSAAGFYAFSNPSDDPQYEHSSIVDNPVFLCPSVPWTNARNYPYGYNHQFLGDGRFKNDDPASGPINFPVRVTRIDSSRTVLAADCLGTAAGKPVADHTEQIDDGSRHADRTARGGHGYALDPPRLTDNCDYADRRSRAPEHRSAPDIRHQRKANVSFCDASVRPMSYEELGYLTGDGGRVEHSGAGATNKWFSGDWSDADPPKLFE